VLDATLAEFVESAAGARLVRAERKGSGASRVTWLVEVGGAGERRPLVLRHDSGDGPLSGTELSLEREAGVYAALADTGVRIPRLLAVGAGGRALLLERAPGSEAFAAVEGPEPRQRLVRDYFSALAALHRVDPGKLALPGFARPADGPDHARADLRLWRRIAATRLSEPDPLQDFSFAWLDANAPGGAERTSLCHGDAGPGNFLFEGDRVTALLDWEFAHLGDPLDDLAWVAVRAQLLGGFGDLRDGFRRWAEASGCALDGGRIEYYRALVLLRMAVSCRLALVHAGARSMDTALYELLLPYLRSLLPEALRRAGCAAAELEELAAAGRAAVLASPVLRAHARPLEPLPLP